MDQNLSPSMNAGGDSLAGIPQWKRVLYYIQLQAPKPKKIVNQNTSPLRPDYYGTEFHGKITRHQADSFLVEDGCYLVRESQQNPGCYTLAIRFNNATKNYKLYYDVDTKQHYVGDKMFEDLDELVADGLICFYVHLKAPDYIASMANESIYGESPYVRYRSDMIRRGMDHPPPQRQPTITRPTNINAASNDTGPGLPPRPPSAPDSSTFSTRHSRQLLPPSIPDSLPPSKGGLDSQDGVNKQVSSAKMADNWMDIMQQEKCHVFKTATFKSIQSCWCEYCAHFMWGLVQQGVECKDCGLRAHKRCSEKVPNDCMPSMKKLKRMFGLDLTTLLKATNKSIPHLVEKCVEEIEARGLHHEGLYRVAGFHDDVEQIKRLFDLDGDADIAVTNYEDVNTITSVLKSFLRMLPVPLITFDVYPKLTETVAKHQKEPVNVRELTTETKTDLTHLPTAHYQTIKYLIGHLNRVTQQQDTNRMSADNLAIVFAPTILQSEQSDPLKAVASGRIEQRVIELLITNYVQIFER